MNDLPWIKYEARMMFCDTADMSRECELAHRRLFDLLCILGKPIAGDDSTIRDASRVKESDWMRVRGELEHKGWHRTAEGWTHDGTAATIADSIESHLARTRQTEAARKARSEARGATAKATDNVTDNVTGGDDVTEREEEEDIVQRESRAPASLETQGGEVEAVRPKGFPVSEQGAVTAGAMVGVPQYIASVAYHKAVSRGYKDAKGQVIVSFTSYLKIEQAYDCNRKAADHNRQRVNGKPNRNAGTLNDDPAFRDQYANVGERL